MFYRILLIGLSLCLLTAPTNRLQAQDVFGDDVEEADSSFDESSPFQEEPQPTEQPTLQKPKPQPQQSFDSSGRRLSVDLVPETHAEIPTGEAMNLLDKAEAALTVDREITPLETMKSVSLLIKHGNEIQTLPLIKKLLAQFLKMNVSQKELFEIADQLGASSLAAILAQNGLAPLNEQAVDRILDGYYTHLNNKDAVEAVLLWQDLKTPEELIFAANQLSKSGRLEIAGRVLKQFLSAEATPDQLAAINKKLGTEDVIRLMTEPSLQPQGQLAAKRIVEGTEAFLKANPPESLAQGLKEIRDADGDKSVIHHGLSVIWQGSETSIEDLIEILCTTQNDEERAQVETVLKSFGRHARDATAVVLESGDSNRVERCAKFLYSWIPTEDAYVFFPALFDERLDEATRKQIGYYVQKLIGRLPSAEQAALVLAKVAKEYAGKDRPLLVDSENMSTLWIPGPAGKPQLVRLPVLDAIRLKTLQMSEQAYKIAPHLNGIATLRFAAKFEKIVYDSGLDRTPQSRIATLLETASGLSVAELDSILAEALRNGWTGAGIAAAELLGETGDADAVLFPVSLARNQTVRPRMLVFATQCNDRRVRFAATEAVMKLAPNRPYPGSSFVSDALTWFAGSEGKQVAVVCCPKIADAMELSGLLAGVGYATKIATRSDDALKEAISSPDVELVLIDRRCGEPIVPVFVQRMENDARTHEIPIAVISADEEIFRATPIEKPLPLMSKLERSISGTSLEHSLAVVLPFPHDREATDFIVGRVRELTGVQEVPAPIRLEQARRSLGWLTANMRDNPKLYRVENLEILARDAAHSPVLAEEGLPLLAQIRSNTAQNALVEIATLESYPEPIREKAAQAFAESVQKHRVLIRGNQVKRLLDTLTVQYEQESPDPIYDTLVKTIEKQVAR